MQGCSSLLGTDRYDSPHQGVGNVNLYYEQSHRGLASKTQSCLCGDEPYAYKRLLGGLSDPLAPLTGPLVFFYNGREVKSSLEATLRALGWGSQCSQCCLKEALTEIKLVVQLSEICWAGP